MARNNALARSNDKAWQAAGCLVLVVAFIIGGLCVAADYTVSDGMRLGTINKFSKRGYIWKTWEGELTMSGLTTASASGANVWHFSIDHGTATPDQERILADRFSALAEKGERVKVRYREVVQHWPWRSETDYFVVSIESCSETPEKR